MKKLTKLLFAGLLALAYVPVIAVSSMPIKKPEVAKADNENSMDVYSFSNLKQALELEHITEIHIRQDLIGERCRIDYLDIGGLDNKQVTAIYQAERTHKTIYLHDGAKAIFSQNPEDTLVQNANLAVNLICVPVQSSLEIVGNGTLGFGALAQSNYNALIYNVGSLFVRSDDVTLISQAIFQTKVKTIYNRGLLGIYGGRVIDSGAKDESSYGVFNAGGSQFRSHRSEIINQYLCSDASSRSTRDYAVYFSDGDSSKPIQGEIIRGSFDRIVAASHNPMQYVDPDSKAYDAKGVLVNTEIKFNQKITIGPEQIVFTKQPVGANAKIGRSVTVEYQITGTADNIYLFNYRNGSSYKMDENNTSNLIIDKAQSKITIPYLQNVNNETEFSIVAEVIFHKDSTPEPITYESSHFVIKWVNFNITFDKGEGSGTMEPVTSNSKNYQLPECTFTPPAGKEFYRWEYNGEQYRASQQVELTADAVLKAIYRDITYEFVTQPTSVQSVANNQNAGVAIFFNANYGNGRMVVKEKTGESTFTFVQVLTENYLYNQYWVAPAQTQVCTKTYRIDVEVGDEIKVSSSLFTVEWVGDALATHTITFNAGDGSGTMEAISIDGVADYILPESTFTAPDGKVFVGWSVNDPFDTVLSVGTKINVAVNTTLYANYESGAQITFYKNGSLSDDDVMSAYAEDNFCGYYTVPDCEFEAPQGQKFVCWNDGTKNYYPGDKVYVDYLSNIEFTAIWEELYYTVAFDNNGGTGEMASTSVSGSSLYTIPECSFTAPSSQYEFAGWGYNSPDGTLHDFESQIYLDEDVVLYAVWHLKEYTVTYNAGTAASTENANLYESVDALTNIDVKNGSIIYEAPVGKHFKEWQVQGSETKVQSGESYEITEDVTFVAIWVDNEVNGDNAAQAINTENMDEELEVVKLIVSFNANGGTGTMNSVTVNKGSSYALPQNTFTAPSGKEFEGWKVNGEGELLQPGASIKVSAAVELVAQWKDQPTSDGSTKPQEPKGLSGGAIAGIVIGSVAVAGLGGFAVFWFVIKKKTFADLLAIFKKK